MASVATTSSSPAGASPAAATTSGGLGTAGQIPTSTPPTAVGALQPPPPPFPYPPLNERREYELTVRQEPKQARMCGVGGKADRRPIDPPPIVQLRLRNKDKDQAREIDDMMHTEYLQNPYYFMFASLAKPDDDTELHWLKDGRTRCTTGSVVSSLYHLKDPASPNEEVGFFVFPDLSVRTEGSYRLKLSLFEVVGNSVKHCKSIFSAPFYVYTAKKFPGMEESTPMSCSLADQGIKIRIRKDIRVRRKPSQEVYGGGAGPSPLLAGSPASAVPTSTGYHTLPAPSASGGIPLDTLSPPQGPTHSGEGGDAEATALPPPSAAGGQPIPTEEVMLRPPLQQKMIGLLPEDDSDDDDGGGKRRRKRQKRSHHSSKNDTSNNGNPPMLITSLNTDVSSGAAGVAGPVGAPPTMQQYTSFNAQQHPVSAGPAASPAVTAISPQMATSSSTAPPPPGYYDPQQRTDNGLETPVSAGGTSAAGPPTTPATPYPGGPPPPAYAQPGYGPPPSNQGYGPPPHHQAGPPPPPMAYWQAQPPPPQHHHHHQQYAPAPPPSHYPPPPQAHEYHQQPQQPAYYQPPPLNHHQGPPPNHWGVQQAQQQRYPGYESGPPQGQHQQNGWGPPPPQASSGPPPQQGQQPQQQGWPQYQPASSQSPYAPPPPGQHAYTGPPPPVYASGPVSSSYYGHPPPPASHYGPPPPSLYQQQQPHSHAHTGPGGSGGPGIRLPPLRTRESSDDISAAISGGEDTEENELERKKRDGRRRLLRIESMLSSGKLPDSIHRSRESGD